MNRSAPPVLLLVLGLALFAHGAWRGIHVVRLRLDGVATNGVVLRVETRRTGSARRPRHETFSVLRVHEHECTVPGEVGGIGQSVPVHYAGARPSDCAVDSGVAMRAPLMTAAPGLLLLVGSYFAFRRAGAGGSADASGSRRG